MDAKTYNGLTRAQQKALRDLFDRSKDGSTNYLHFIGRAHESHLMGCIMIPWCGMQIGIEKDGYTHS